MNTFSILDSSLLLFLLIVLVVGCEMSTNNQIEEENEIERSYSKTIEREYNSEFELELIEKAESAYLPRDSMITVLENAGVYLGSLIVPEEKYWYWNISDDVLIPFSITKDAVEYYSDVIASAETGKSHHILKDIDFVYRAEITFEKEFEFSNESYDGSVIPIPSENKFKNVFVIHMRLSWVHNRIEDSRLYITHERVVVFDEGGTLKSILLDGIWPVSIN